MSTKVYSSGNGKNHKGTYFEYEGIWYFRTGLIQIWDNFCEKKDRFTDPPILKKELQDWLDLHNIDRIKMERDGVPEFIFDKVDDFILFRMTWL